ncbi:flippase [Bifidobacterium samirii]|uniref:Flippase n=1 Tax=Bifidobacterium samirii TaxID=2306974 RepID=A0A430FR49_9BIFI|nr:flippase [Bifidobacterium samirii]RSX55310.1 Flippase [Bifidobacterium samirii]
MPANSQSNEQKPKIRSVKFNVLMNMILTSSAFIFPLITVPYVSRVLSPTGTGAVAFGQSIGGYFATIALLGIPQYGIRECAKVRDDSKRLSTLVKELLCILMTSSSIMYGIFLICLFAIPRLSQDKPLMIICSAMIILSSFGVEWFYQAIEQYGYITVRNIAFKFLGLALMLIFVHNTEDYRIYALITVIASYGSNILNFIRLHRFISLKNTDSLNIRRHFKPMFSFIVISISSGVYLQIDTLILGLMSSNAIVGIYQLAVKIKTLLLTCINSLGGVLLPRLSYYYANGKAKNADSLFGRFLHFSLIISTAATLLGIICAPQLVLIIGGAQFTASAVPLAIAVTALPFAAVNAILQQTLVADSKEKQASAATFMGLFIALAVNLTLIPVFGANGAALGNICAEIGTFVIRAWLLRSRMRSIIAMLDLPKILFASLIGLVIAGFIWLNVVPNVTVLPQIVCLGLGFSLGYGGTLLIIRDQLILEICGRFLPIHHS